MPTVGRNWVFQNAIHHILKEASKVLQVFCAMNVVFLTSDYQSKPKSLNQTWTSTLQLPEDRREEQTLMMKFVIEKPCVYLADVSSSWNK